MKRTEAGSQGTKSKSVEKVELFDLLHRQPPSDVSSEMACVCAIMFSSVQLEAVCDIVKAEDFSDQDNAAIFAAVVYSWGERGECSMDLIVARLREQGDWRDTMFDGLANIMEHDDGSHAHALYFATRVRDSSMRRRLGIVIENSIRHVVDENMTADQVVSKTLEGIYEIEGERKNQSKITTATLVQTFLDSIDDRNRGEMPVGFSDLDKLLAGGLRPSNLVLLAARPSIGKSSLALDIALNVANHSDKSVAMFSLEMGAEDVSHRIMSKATGVPLHRIRERRLGSKDLQRINDATEKVESLKIQTICGDVTMVGILQHCRTLATTEGLAMVVVDYLTLVTPNRERGKSREQEVSEISRFLKGLAGRLNVPVLACAQLNRDVEKMQRPPRLSDLRESGALEQDADVVFLLHKEQRESSTATVAISKHRNGPLGGTTLDWDGGTCTFSDQQPAYAADFNDWNER